MTNHTEKGKPWLVAAWPGMGNVAVIAAGYLVQKLGVQAAGEVHSKDFFDIQQVEVRLGVITPPRLPRGLFFKWTNPGAGRDLIVFLGEAQPTTSTYSYAHALLDHALEMGVERVVTFASMATALHPSQDPRVFGVATGETTLADLKRVEVEPLEEGQIGGLNGVLLGAAMEKGVPGMCLLGEIPFFAAGVPNPKASRVVLSVFSVLAGVDVSLDELSAHAESMEQVILQLMEKMEKEGTEQGEEGDEEEEGDETPTPPVSEPPPEPKPVEKKAEKPLDFATRDRIERLFDEARKDKSKSMHLKTELDRLGVFERYENRFLDLFKRGE